MLIKSSQQGQKGNNAIQCHLYSFTSQLFTHILSENLRQLLLLIKGQDNGRRDLQVVTTS